MDPFQGLHLAPNVSLNLAAVVPGVFKTKHVVERDFLPHHLHPRAGAALPRLSRAALFSATAAGSRAAATSRSELRPGPGAFT